MIRVMIVTNSLTGGGAERSMNLVANELWGRGWPIALVPINSSGPDLILPNCETYPLSRKWRGGLVATILSIWRFNKIVRSFNPAVLILNCDLPELFGSLLFSKRILVVLQHSSKPWGTRVTIGKITRKILKFRNAIWIAVSNHLEIWPYSTSPSAVLKNPFSPDASRVYSTSCGKLKRIVFIGRLSPEKRPEFAVEVAHKLGVGANIIGDGLLLSSLIASVNQREENIQFVGWQENPWSLVENGDLLIIPSLYEGDGLIVIEALHRKIPLLLSDTTDFQRFELPTKNYCKNLEDFVSRAQEYNRELGELIVPDEIAELTLNPRDIKSIGDDWEIFLNTLYRH